MGCAAGAQCSQSKTVCKSDEVKWGLSPVSNIRYFDVHKTPWIIRKSEIFAWKYFIGITAR